MLGAARVSPRAGQPPAAPRASPSGPRAPCQARQPPGRGTTPETCARARRSAPRAPRPGTGPRRAPRVRPAGAVSRPICPRCRARDLQESSAQEASLILTVLLPGAALRTAQALSEGSSTPACNALRKPRERLAPSHPLPRFLRRCAGRDTARFWPRFRQRVPGPYSDHRQQSPPLGGAQAGGAEGGRRPARDRL